MYLAKYFISSFVYAVDFSKNYTSVRIDKNKKKNTSMAIPPDPDLAELAIKRVY